MYCANSWVCTVMCGMYLHICTEVQNCCLEFSSITPHLIFFSQISKLNPELTNMASVASLVVPGILCLLSQDYRWSAVATRHFVGTGNPKSGSQQVV